jgi:hypothetical protein
VLQVFCYLYAAQSPTGMACMRLLSGTRNFTVERELAVLVRRLHESWDVGETAVSMQRATANQLPVLLNSYKPVEGLRCSIA